MEYLNLRDAEGLCPPAYADGRLQIDPKLVEAYKKEIKSERPKPKSAYAVLIILTVIVGLCIALYLCLKSLEKVPAMPQIVAVLVFVFLLACAVVCIFTIPLRIDEKQNFDWLGYGQKLLDAEFVAAVKPFRDYYGYTEPNVVTKCFAASDGKFVLRDVCVFVAADGTLRIAADIRHGFLRIGHDLGCYAFGREEISVSERNKSELCIEDGSKRQGCAYLAAGETYFVLADRALKLLKDFKERGPQKENGENFPAGIDKRQNS